MKTTTEKWLTVVAIIENPKTNVWHNKQRFNANSIENTMKKIISNSPLEGSKRKLTID